MDCAQFEELLHDLDRPGTEGFARREAALTHAESCSRCGILVMQSESLDEALRALAKRESGRHASPPVAAMLMEEFQHRKFALLSRKVTRQIAALGATAAVLLGLGFWLHFAHSQTPPIAINEQPSAQTAPSSSAGPGSGERELRAAIRTVPGPVHGAKRVSQCSARKPRSRIPKRRRVHSLALRRRSGRPR